MAVKAPDEITISLSYELVMSILETWLNNHLLSTRHNVVAIDTCDDQVDIEIRPHPKYSA